MAPATDPDRKEASLNSVVRRLDALIAQQQATNQLLSRLVGLTQVVADLLSSCLPAIATACQELWCSLQAASRHRAVADCVCIANAVRWVAMLFSCFTLQHIARQHACNQAQRHSSLSSLSTWVGSLARVLTKQSSLRPKPWQHWVLNSPLEPFRQATCQRRHSVSHLAGTLLVGWASYSSLRSLWAPHHRHSSYWWTASMGLSQGWGPGALGYELGPLLVQHVISPTICAAAAVWLSSGSWPLFLFMQCVWAATLLQPPSASTGTDKSAAVPDTHGMKHRLRSQAKATVSSANGSPQAQHGILCKAGADKKAALWSVLVTIILPLLNGILPYVWPWLLFTLTSYAALAVAVCVVVMACLPGHIRSRSLQCSNIGLLCCASVLMTSDGKCCISELVCFKEP